MPATSKHKQIADAVADVIVALDLDGIEEKVHVFWGADTEAVNLPAVFVCPIGQKSYEYATNERDDHLWPISVYIVGRKSIRDPSLMDESLVWREAIEKAFISQRLSGMSSVFYCELDGVPIVDPEWATRYSMLVSPIRLRFRTRETRG